MPRSRRPTKPAPVSGTLSRLKADPRRPERTVLYLDGRRAGDIATEIVEAAGLCVGEAVSEEVLTYLRRQDEPQRARSRALRLLALRERSTSEVKDRLRQAGFAAATVEDVVAWLESLEYLDDGRFSQHLAMEKAKAGWGERRIRAELQRKGIDSTTAEDALLAVAHDDEARAAQTDGLVEVARRRFGRQWQKDRVSAERRLAGFLLRRGHDWETVAWVSGRLDAEQEGESNPRP